MGHVSYTQLRQNLARYMDEVCDSGTTLVVTRQNARAVVMLSLEEFESIEETLHLLRSGANAARVMRAVEAAEQGRLVEHDIDLP